MINFKKLLLMKFEDLGLQPPLLKALKDKGYFLLAISHSPKTILDKFCPGLGFDKTYGVVYEIGPQELFTGKVIDEHLIYNKANIVGMRVVGHVTTPTQ